jgi:hypothetical protein
MAPMPVPMAMAAPGMAGPFLQPLMPATMVATPAGTMPVPGAGGAPVMLAAPRPMVAGQPPMTSMLMPMGNMVSDGRRGQGRA